MAVRNNEPFVCRGAVNLDLVRVTMRTNVEDAIRLDQNCSGRIGRVEVDGASTPTDVVCDGCVLGPHSAQTLFYAPSLRSGARNTTICHGRYSAVRVEAPVQAIVNVNNTVLPRNHPSCANVTGR